MATDVDPLHAVHLPAVSSVVEADSALAFRRFLEAASPTFTASERRTIERFLVDPAGFRLRGDEGDAAFLDLASEFVAARLAAPWIDVTTAWVAEQTWRTQPEGEAATVAALEAIRADADARIAQWNAATPGRHALVPFRWHDADLGAPAETTHVFGASLGAGPRRLVLLAHVDTVGPIDDEWSPFEARLEIDSYRDQDTLMLRGRGAVDDKGPAAAALLTLEGLRAVLGDNTALDELRFDVAFDTAEETSMTLPAWLADVGHPEMGVVLDSVWSVFAEKGGESTRLAIQLNDNGAPPVPQPAQIQLDAVFTPDGPSNQIPATAEARLTASEQGAEADVARLTAALDFFAESWDGAKDVITIWPTSETSLRILARGSGAAHGSAPDVNRAEGHNPLTCLCSFLAFCAGDPFPNGALADDPNAVILLNEEGLLASTNSLVLPRFINWAFGREVFGEQHPDALRAADEIYRDGTTYAVTRLNRRGIASVDIRYALGHHAVEWDRETYGSLPGESRFDLVWTHLIAQFHEILPPGSASVTYVTSTWAPPDIKDRTHPGWLALQAAFEDTMGRPSPQLAIGGGTDAKGHLELFATGPNFGETMSEIFAAPVNYHGRDEAVVVQHIVDTVKVVTRWALVEALSERE